jgi:hypothetical protein
MGDICGMKIRRLLPALLILTAGGLVLETAHANWPYRRVQYNYNRPRPAPPVNHGSGSAEPVDKPAKFKDLPLNAQFYFVADKDRKLFPRIKVSSTAAKTVPTAGNPTVSTNAIPGETLVIMKKEQPKKDETKNGGEKKGPDGKKEEK